MLYPRRCFSVCSGWELYVVTLRRRPCRAVGVRVTVRAIGRAVASNEELSSPTSTNKWPKRREALRRATWFVIAKLKPLLYSMLNAGCCFLLGLLRRSQCIHGPARGALELVALLYIPQFCIEGSDCGFPPGPNFVPKGVYAYSMHACSLLHVHRSAAVAGAASHPREIAHHRRSKRHLHE